jgi:uncharacterized membrane protein YhaH (DUF805 family)
MESRRRNVSNSPGTEEIPMKWYLEALKKYAVFRGRARRKEYWYFYLFTIISAFVLGLVGALAGIAPDRAWSFVAGLYMMASVIPALAVAARRLHDTGRSGWWVLVGYVPIVGTMVLVFFAVLDSEPGDNRYGPNPKQSVAV